MEETLTPMMQEATDALIGNLLASEAFIRYQQARNRMNKNHHAHALLEQLSQAQARLREKQANNDVARAEVESVRALQEQVHSNDIIMDYARSQQDALNFLREINTEISQLLGINFASFANHATC